MTNDYDYRSGAGNLLTFLFGIGVGVAGTLIYAAINEEQFNQVVGKTKSIAGSVQDSVGDYVEDATTKVKQVKGKAQDVYDDTVAKVKSKATDVADDVQSAAKHAKSEINS